MMPSRRDFVGLLGSAAVSLATRAVASNRTSNLADARIDVLINEPIGTIAPEIQGHFVEHLGGVVYDGIWVGEGSRVPNVSGIRKEIVDRLRAIKSSVIRWPGGCFADQYDWRDGVGARASRPKRTNFWVRSPEWPATAGNGPQRYDTNHFGTIEFARFCKLSGSQPYFAANVRSLRPHDFWQWAEYCNSPAGTTTLADLREKDGEREPLNVRYWGVGNESWGCGGNFNPEEYATEFRRYTAWVPRFPGQERLFMVGSGPNGDDLGWTRRFFDRVGRGLGDLWGWALHHYSWNASSGRTNDWFQGKGDALNFDSEQYYEILREANRVEQLITGHWSAMGEFDRQHRVKIVVDEWGAWYKPGTEPFPDALLGQQNTMRDAVLAGLSLDIFNRHADKVAMANIAQLVNCLQSLFLAHEDKFCVTPTYHVFSMNAAHQGAQSLRTIASAPQAAYSRNVRPASIPGLSASASLNAKQLTITATNTHLTEDRETEISIRGAAINTIKALTLSAPDVHACNTFANPNTVAPREQTVSANSKTSANTVVIKFPKASVTKLEIALT